MTRRVALAAGSLVLLGAWVSPLPGLAGSAFVSHTIAHVAAIGVAAPLIAIWLAPAVRRGDSAAEAFLSPLPVALFAFTVVWTWHLPLLHGLARLSDVVWSLEQVSFLVAGLLLWTSVLRRPAGSAADGAGILALLMTSAQMILLGTVLALASRPLYPYGIETLGDVYALLAGQRLGGMLLLLVGGLPYLAGGLWLVGRTLRRPAERGASRVPAAGTDIAVPSALHEAIDP